MEGTVPVTGGAGFVGSHSVVESLPFRYAPVVLADPSRANAPSGWRARRASDTVGAGAWRWELER